MIHVAWHPHKQQVHNPSNEKKIKIKIKMNNVIRGLQYAPTGAARACQNSIARALKDVHSLRPLTVAISHAILSECKSNCVAEECLH